MEGFYDLTFDVEGEEGLELEDLETDEQQNHKPDDDGDLGDDFKEALAKPEQQNKSDNGNEGAAKQGAAENEGGPAAAPPTQTACLTGVVFSPSVRRAIQQAKACLASIGSPLCCFE
jgi:hypothetical protein